MLVINELNMLSYLFKNCIKGEYEKIYQLSKKKAVHWIICNYDIDWSASFYRAYISTVALDGSQVGKVRILHIIKDDVEELTAEELDHLQRYLLRNYNEDKEFCCC